MTDRTKPAVLPPTRGAGRRQRRRARLARDACSMRPSRASRAAASRRLRCERSLAEAGVTPAMLHYYFGDKDALHAGLGRRAPGAGHWADAMRLRRPATIRRRWSRDSCAVSAEVIRTHPWLPPLWVREVLCEGGALREMLLHGLAPKLPACSPQRFAVRAARGRLNPGPGPAPAGGLAGRPDPVPRRGRTDLAGSSSMPRR